jgi:microcystin-dependent protein
MATNNGRNNKGQFPIGSIIRLDFAPPVDSGWLACDGSTLDTTTYSLLFAVIGYTYGGSGANFDLPTIADNIIRYQ